ALFPGGLGVRGGSAVPTGRPSVRGWPRSCARPLGPLGDACPRRDTPPHGCSRDHRGRDAAVAVAASGDGGAPRGPRCWSRRAGNDMAGGPSATRHRLTTFDFGQASRASRSSINSFSPTSKEVSARQPRTSSIFFGDTVEGGTSPGRFGPNWTSVG